MHKLFFAAIALLFFASLMPKLSSAATYILPPDDVDVIGEVFQIPAREEDTLLDIGRRYGVGYEEMRIANPNVDTWLPGEGTLVTVPAQYILPRVDRKGIVLNIPEMRLYYFPNLSAGQKPVVMTFPVSIGRMDWNTPLGETRIVKKVANPSWYPPASIRKEHEEDGDPLPEVVPPGPNNPLGAHSLRLGIPGYLIHGTNRPEGVGMRVTHGCVRMFPEDIKYLFDNIDTGTRVLFVNHPFKAGWLADTLFLEAHPLLEEDQTDLHTAHFVPMVDAVSSALEMRADGRVDRIALKAAIEQITGVPIAISR